MWFKHGLYKSPEYSVWLGIKKRCYSSTHNGYARYGGRGIKVCARWLGSFTWFLVDMGPRPSSDYWIDRIDVDGDYEPGNCKWSTATEQNRNTSANRKITVDGVTLTATEWSLRLGGNRSLVINRILMGWDEALAATASLGSAKVRE